MVVGWLLAAQLGSLAAAAQLGSLAEAAQRRPPASCGGAVKYLPLARVALRWHQLAGSAPSDFAHCMGNGIIRLGPWRP